MQQKTKYTLQYTMESEDVTNQDKIVDEVSVIQVTDTTYTDKLEAYGVIECHGDIIANVD